MAKRLVLLVLGAFAGALALSSATAGAQAGEGTVTIRVVDDSTGQLTQRDVCHELYTFQGGFFAGTSDVPVGSVKSHTLNAGNYEIRITSCFGDATPEFTSVWHDGSPSFVDNRFVRADTALTIDAGTTQTITVRVSGAMVLAEFTGTDGRCTVEFYGADQQSLRQSTATAVFDDGFARRTVVAPGAYLPVARCGSSGMLYGTNETPFINEAQWIEFSDLQSVTLTYDRADFGTLDQRALRFQLNERSAVEQFCVDVELLDGRVTDRFGYHLSPSEITMLSGYGDRRFRIWDCFDDSFDAFWFPRASTRNEGRVVSVLRGPGTKNLDTLVQVVVDPALVCNGLPATIVGTDGDDIIAGTDHADVIMGLEGRDWIRAGDGKDTVCGGEGRDRLYGGRQADRLYGGPDGDFLKGESGADALFGEGGRDRIVGANGNDYLRGGGGAVDTLDGRGGTDTCHDISNFTRFLECETLKPAR